MDNNDNNKARRGTPSDQYRKVTTQPALNELEAAYGLLILSKKARMFPLFKVMPARHATGTINSPSTVVAGKKSSRYEPILPFSSTTSQPKAKNTFIKVEKVENLSPYEPILPFPSTTGSSEAKNTSVKVDKVNKKDYYFIKLLKNKRADDAWARKKAEVLENLERFRKD